ncbi:CobW family GTP-binding protein [Bacillus massilinigeriensis]|uniref:CobW family GTP-binding protein n=1 Tax=Bacillus massilionigeriensis TaxID=1805475 RepID=UPI00096B66E6|nr:GTP-binding protein [Bacillus massilionigeriensis]
MEKKTEIYILSGFLGSGKTTLLKNLLQEEKKDERKVAVMMNELGEVSIDSHAVQDDDITLRELLDGCICCTIQDKLESQLQGLLMNDKPEVIYIETTGAAHPVEVFDAILSPLFADRLDVRGIVTLVDSLQWSKRKEFSPQVQQLLLEQVRHADLILLNKVDCLTESEQGKLVMEIQGVNTYATTILTTFAKVPLQKLKGMRWNRKSEKQQSHVHLHLHLSSFVYRFQHSVQQQDFEEFLKSLPDTIYRIKGYIKFPHSNVPYLFQYSYGMPLYMKENMNYPLNLVFIGEGIDWSILESKLQELERGEG